MNIWTETRSPEFTRVGWQTTPLTGFVNPTSDDVWETAKTIGGRSGWGMVVQEPYEQPTESAGFETILLYTHALEPREVNAGELCRYRAERMIEQYAGFPASYNQVLLQGALDYCGRVLVRLDERQEFHRALLGDIRKFVNRAEALYRQYANDLSSSFGRLDLRMVEDRFELIQSRSARLGIFPRLREVPIRQLLGD